MKKNRNNLMKKFALALAFAVVLSTALAGCGQSTEPSSGSAPQSSAEERPNSSSSAEEASAASSALEERDTASVTEDSADSSEQDPAPESDGLSGIDLNVQFGDSDPFTMHLYDNDTAAKIAEYVGTAAWRLPIYHYDDYDNWEVMQYYDIPSRYEIPSNPVDVTNEQAGTVYYSEPNRIVLFYQDAEVPSEYTPVGYIDYSQAFVDAVVNNPVVEGWGNKLVHISNAG